MQCSKLHGFIILVMIYVHSYESCSVNEVRKCKHYNLIARMQFHEFISLGIKNLACRMLQTAIACAYQKGRLEDCSLFFRLPFDTQLGVINAVCVHRREEYLRSSKCFSKQDVINHISTQCLSTMASSKLDTCRNSDLVLACVRTKVLMTTGCDPADADLMVDLMKSFVQPIREASNCSNSKAGITGGSEQEIVGDETMHSNTNSVLVTNITSQKPLLTENPTINNSFDGKDGGDSKSATYESQGTLPQNINHDTTEKYPSGVTLPSQSVSLTNMDDKHRAEHTSPDITHPQNQDVSHQWQEIVFLPASSTHLQPENGLEPSAIKSTTKHSANTVASTVGLESENTNHKRKNSDSPMSQSNKNSNSSMSQSNKKSDRSMSQSNKLCNSSMSQSNNNSNCSMSQSNKTLGALALKSTQGSGHASKPLPAMLLPPVISLVLFVI